jgi:F420-non-reducing hydrogenase small subunit
MSAKPTLALYWAASCGGCEIAVLGLNEQILEVANAFEIVFWPCVMDPKVSDIEDLPDRSIDVCLFNGAIRTSEQEFMAQLLRRKSKVLVAFGACATDGGIPALANLCDKEDILRTSYRDSPSTENPDVLYPRVEVEVAEGVLQLPALYDTVRTLDQTVDVDYRLPGCPPEPARIADAVEAIIAGSLPAPGAVIGAQTTVCEECDRRRDEKRIREFKRTWQLIPDPEICLLEQGLLCHGVATRSGCGARCPQVNSPCIGCYGSGDGAEDPGARMIGALASVIDATSPDEIDRILDEGIPDPVGSFYRFSLAGSLLRRRQLTENHELSNSEDTLSTVD